ncbi:MAG: TonB-dependent receptor [Prevotella sp.]|nr:TonB-dependent receptor [Prevotella sp.]
MYLQLKRATVALFLSLFCFVAYAQQTVTGTVKDATGEPLIGVTVLMDGQTAAITDIDGNFTINNAKPSSVIKISYIGYADQQITLGNRTSLSIIMQEDNQSLDEVVVVGYGTMKKSDLTGSVSSVNTEQLNAKGASSVMGNLQGSNPGVNITQASGRAGGDFKIEIRGKSSINSDTTPLYVVDGVMCSDIQWLNPQDIEKIDILKDASSTAIYGSRATAGVVMVTTKSGAGVSKEQKPTISYDGYYGISKVARMPDFQNASEFYSYRLRKFTEFAGDIDAMPIANPVYAFSQAAFYQAKLAEYATRGDFILDQLYAQGRDVNWPDLVTQTGSQQNHFLAVSGGSANVNYHFGIGFNKDKGIYIGDEQTRYNFKGSVDAKINKVISAGFSINLANINNKYADDNAIREAYRANPFMAPYDEEGNIIHNPGLNTAFGTDGNQFTSSINPLDLMKSSKTKRETWRILGNFYLKFDIMKGLDFKTTFSPNYTHYRHGYFDGYVNPLTGNAYRDDSNGYDGKEKINQANVTNYRNFSWTWDNVITYNTTIAKDHNLNLMGLFSMEKGNTENYYWAATNVMANTDWWNMNTGTYDGDNSKTTYSESSMISYAFRANYNWKNRYYLTGTIRWDGSSKFAEGNRWGCFPSVAAAWRITEENFMKNVEWVSNLKFRLSYGITGNNDGIGSYATQQTVSGPVYYPFGATYYNGYYPSSVVNKELQWEKSHEFNVGLDFGFLRDRIRGSIDWYNKKSTDLLYKVQLPLEAGGGTMTTNIGSVRNRGIEISLTTVNIKNSDWNWETTFTFSHNKNKVLEINGTGDRVTGSDLTTGSLFIGSSVNNIYAYQWGGIVTDRDMVVPNNQAAIDHGFRPGETVKEYDYYYTVYKQKEGQPWIVDQNGDGTINDNDRCIMSADPTWIGSLTSNLSWKNWDFGFSLYAKVGGKAFSKFLQQYEDVSDRGRMRLNEDYYIPAGQILNAEDVLADGTYVNPVYQETTHYGSFPIATRADNNGLGSMADYWNNARCVTKTSYLKVQNITLGYTFPKTWINKFGCQHLRLYFTVTNPFVFTGFKGFDPEWASASLSNDTPSTVTYQFGASIKF